MISGALDPTEQQVYRELKRIAATPRGLVSYGILFDTVAMGNKKYRNAWRRSLGNISNYTYAFYPGEELRISAIVYNIDTGYAGRGFFELDGIPGRLRSAPSRLSDAHKRFIDEQRDRVWGHDWARNP